MAGETWNIDTAHSSINFSVRHMVIAKVRGRFTRWSGTIEFDEQDLSATQATVTIEAASIDTHEQRRDDHLRSVDFLDVHTHPEISFRTTRAIPAGPTTFGLYGELIVRDAPLAISLRAEYLGRATDPWGGERIAFEAKTTVDRADYGITWNKALETGSFLVGDTVEITVEIEAVMA